MDYAAAVEQAVTMLASTNSNFDEWCIGLEESINSAAVHDRQSISATNTEARSCWLQAFAMPICVRILSDKLKALTVTVRDNSGRRDGLAVLYAEQLLACRRAVRALSALIVDGPDPSQPESRAREAKREFAEYGGIAVVCDALRLALQALHDLGSSHDNEARAVPSYSPTAAGASVEAGANKNAKDKPKGVAISYRDNAAVHAALQLGTDAAWALCWATRWDDIQTAQSTKKAAGLVTLPGRTLVASLADSTLAPAHYLAVMPPRVPVQYRIDCALAADVPAYLVAAVSRWQSAPHVAAACAYVISNIVYKHRAATEAIVRMRGIKCLVGSLAGASLDKPDSMSALGAAASAQTSSQSSKHALSDSNSSQASAASLACAKQSADFVQVASNAASALGNLSNTLPEQGPFADRHRAITAAGAIPLLVKLGEMGDSSARQRAVMTLSNLAQSPDTADELLLGGAVALFAQVVADADAEAVSADATSTPFATVKAIMGLAFVLGPQIDAGTQEEGGLHAQEGGVLHAAPRGHDQAAADESRPRMQQDAIEHTSSLMVSVNAINVIVQQLCGAIAGHKWAGTSAGECFHALQLLALSEHNHGKLIAAGLVPCIMSALQRELSDQQAREESSDTIAAEHAARCAARLAFSREGVAAILSCDGLHGVLHELGKVSGSAAARSAAVAAWNVRAHGGEASGGKTIAQLDHAAAAEAPSGKHIMLSYSWKYQPLVLALREKLKHAGYSVWVDVEKMAGSKLDAMAHAVENASVVMFTVCSAYFESANCRLEAEYATECGVPMLPIHVQPGYVPRGWLGFIMGSKLWYSIVQPVDIPAVFPRLEDAIARMGVHVQVTHGGASAAAAQSHTHPRGASDVDAQQDQEVPLAGPAAATDAQMRLQQFCKQHALSHEPLLRHDFDFASLKELRAICDGLPPRERFDFLSGVAGLPAGQTLRLSAALRLL